MDPSLDVALETSRREASVALGVGETVLTATLGGGAHASDLLPCLGGLLEQAGVAWPASALPLKSLFVGLGPGSYTGLRVGIATALGLARASGAALYGLSSFEALAFAELAPGEEGSIVLDARAGRFYHGRYQRGQAGLAVLEAPLACAADELEELVERGSARGAFLAHPEVLEAAGLELAPGVRLRTDAMPCAGALLALGRARVAAGELAPSRTLEPLYLVAFGGHAG